jgi:RNA-binding protein
LISGNITHIDNKGNLIARTKKTPREGAKVIDRRKTVIGTVVSIIGPVDSPYLVIRPMRDIEKRMVSLINEAIVINE